MVSLQTPGQNMDPTSSVNPLEKLRDRAVFIETYGCRYNFGDTAKLVEVLKKIGCTMVDLPDKADAVIINTCTVVGATERKMLRRLAQLSDRDLYVTGCMTVVQREAIFGVSIPTIIHPELIHSLYSSVGTVESGNVGIVQIARGCQGGCTYCITCFARGPLRSYREEEILGQVQAFIRAGAAEIQLTAQDVSAWGMETGRRVSELLTLLGRQPGPHMIRVGMMNPATVKIQTGELVDAFASDHIYKFLHIPVQSGSDHILGMMRRGYSVAEFKRIVDAFRERYPGITIATDVIVGFPGESDEDFSATVDLIREIRPGKVNVTRYSPRPYTQAAKWNEVPETQKKTRSRILNAVANEVYASINTPALGSIVPFTVTENLKEGSVMARTPEYTGLVLDEVLPVGGKGFARLKKDRRYFFTGERIGNL
jgi:MiaB-like tRNA modifying enzyme